MMEDNYEDLFEGFYSPEEQERAENERLKQEAAFTGQVTNLFGIVVRGSELDPKRALYLLIEEYMDCCSDGEMLRKYRTLYYEAAQAIFDRFIKTDDPLAVSLRERGIEFICECMVDFNEMYDPKVYDSFEIYRVEEMSEYIDLILSSIRYDDPDCAAALCYGMYFELQKYFKLK